MRATTIKTPHLVPLFNTLPHSPARCGEVPEHLRPYLPKKKRRKKGEKSPAARPCETCGGNPIPTGSAFICMGCHGVAADKAEAVAAHVLPPLPYDRRKGEPKPVKPPKLTAKERAALLADAEADESMVDPATVIAFLATVTPDDRD